MCEVCGKYPCDPRCPNAPEPKPVLECDSGGEGIFEGDEYFDDNGKAICMDCLENMNLNDLLDLFDVKLDRAEPYEPYFDDIGD